MRIDVHCHGWSEKYLDRVLTYGVIPPGMLNFVRGMGGLTTEADMTERYRVMDEAGVDLQVISPAGMVIYSEDEQTAIEFAQFCNDDYAAIAARHDRIECFATLPIPHVGAALTEIARALDDLNMAGIQFPTSVHGLSLTDERFEPLWAELNRRSATVFFHPAGEGIHSTLLADYGLSWLAGAPMEDSFAAIHAMATNIPLRYPDVNIVIAHLGGILPMMVGRLDDQADTTANRWTDENPASSVAKGLYYDVVGHRHAPALRCAVDTFGADRIVLGSDFPWQVGERYVGGVRYVEDAGLEKADVELILDRNLDSLFSS